MQKIKGLDTLRAFAVILVFIEHFGVWFDYTSPSGKFVRDVVIPDGGFGVNLFFVLSGFLITSILLKAKGNSGDTGRGAIIKNFYARRALRIFPIYYLLLFVLCAINYPDVRHYFWYFATYTANILCYRTNSWNHFSHTWTLAVEEQFYLLWPWLMIQVRDKYIKYVLCGALVVGIVSTYIVTDVQGHIAPLLVVNSFDAFGIGGLYAWARLNDERCRKFEAAVKLLVVAALAVYFYRKVAFCYDYPTVARFMNKTTDSIIALWLIILVMNNKREWVGRYVLGSRPLNYIGKISYGLYLYHYVYISFFFAIVNKFFYDITLPYPAINEIIHSQKVDYCLETLIMVGVAVISYEVIEKPILRLKKYFDYSES